MEDNSSRTGSKPFDIQAPTIDFSDVFECPGLISQLRSQNKALENLRHALDMDSEDCGETRADHPHLDEAV